MNDHTKSNGEPSILRTGCGYAYRREAERRRVGIIGAGPAGLAALRRVAQADLEVVCFEQGRSLGGIWNYTESTGTDEAGYPVHAFIYRDLRTNLPKETMMFPDYPYKPMPESYIHADQVVSYLKEFTQHYDLDKYIKYRHKVTHLKPLSSCWSLTAKDLTTQQDHVFLFDSVFVCSGPFATPVYPDIELAKFSGHQIHSKEFRTPEPYKDKTVLVIGLGPSGLDITYLLSPYAKQIYLSQNRGNVHIAVPENAVLKPQVKSVEDNTIYFMDGSAVQVNSIIHCTGYTFNYPFLDNDCEVTVDKFVFPLYKHFISIKRPTLFFIGLPRPISHLFMCDFQVRAAVKYLLGEIDFPSESQMMDDLKKDIEKRQSDGQKKHNFHQLGRATEQYFNDLSDLGQFDKIPPVQIAMFSEAHLKSIRDFASFRKYSYTIINDKEYELKKLD